MIINSKLFFWKTQENWGYTIRQTLFTLTILRSSCPSRRPLPSLSNTLKDHRSLSSSFPRRTRLIAATYSKKSILLSWKQGNIIIENPTGEIFLDRLGKEICTHNYKDRYFKMLNKSQVSKFCLELQLKNATFYFEAAYSHYSCQMLGRCCPYTVIQVYHSVLQTSSWTRASTKIHLGTQ